MAKTQAVFLAVSCIVLTIILVDADTNYGEAGWGWANSGSTTKPGDCPASNSFMECSPDRLACESDCECPQKQKCCFQPNCGSSCSEPTIIIDSKGTCNEPITSVKPGSCPAPNPSQTCVQCYDQCVSDCQCAGLAKCCRSKTCGNECVNI